MNQRSGYSVVNTIGDVSTLFVLTPRAIRFYEERGLIVTRRDGRNRRVFDDQTRRRLQLIATLRRSHLPLPEIADILDCEGGETKQIGAAMGKLATQRRRLERLLQDLEAAMDELAAGQAIAPRNAAA